MTDQANRSQLQEGQFPVKSLGSDKTRALDAMFYGVNALVDRHKDAFRELLDFMANNRMTEINLHGLHIECVLWHAERSQDVPANNRDAAMTPPILGGDHGAEPSSIPAQRTSTRAEAGTSAGPIDLRDLVPQIAEQIAIAEQMMDVLLKDDYERLPVYRETFTLAAQRIVGLLERTQPAETVDRYSLDEAFQREAREAVFDYVLRTDKTETDPMRQREHAHAIADSLTCRLPERARKMHRLVNENLAERRADSLEAAT